MSAETAAACEPAHAKRTPWWLWPHVLSLEAPLVAVLWQGALAQAHGIRLTPMLSVGLGLACWVVYLLDRTLDARAAPNAAELDVRHAFYHRHGRVVLWGVVPAALGVLGWLALWVLPQGVLWQAVGLGLLVALYLAAWAAKGSRVMRDVFISCAGLGGIVLVSRMPLENGTRLTLSLLVLGVMLLSFLRQMDVKMGAVLPKEMAAAVLFAMGCTAGTRFFGMAETVVEPVVESVLLTLLFACNLHGITCREAGVQEDPRHTRLLLGTLAFALVVRVCTAQGVLEHGLAGPADAVLGGVLLLWVVHGLRRRFSADAYRVLADVAVILPLPLMLAQIFPPPAFG